MSDENVSKTNGLGVDPMQRLASFKPPRDYSLGPVKPNKKVFTPNLNVTRNKNKGSSSNNTREHKKEEKGRRDRKNNRNKDFNKNDSNIIKSSGVFSEGLAEKERNYHRSSFVRESSASAPITLQKPTIRINEIVKIDKEFEDQRIRMLMNSGGVVDIETEDFNQCIDLEAPVRLPMDDISCSNSKHTSEVQVKKEVIVKTELPGDAGIFPEVDTKPAVGVKMEAFEDTDVVDILRSNNPTMVLFKLPDTLPGRGVSGEDDGPPRRKQPEQPSTSTRPAEGNNTTGDRCCLNQLAEGRIGTLLVRQSGRVTLRLGDSSFEVSLGTKSAFYQEVVSVGLDAASRSARMVSLGSLQHKLTAVPDWENMFDTP